MEQGDSWGMWVLGRKSTESSFVETKKDLKAWAAFTSCFLSAVFNPFVHPETQGERAREQTGISSLCSISLFSYPDSILHHKRPCVHKYGQPSLHVQAPSTAPHQAPGLGVHSQQLICQWRIHPEQIPMKSLEWAQSHLDRELWVSKCPECGLEVGTQFWAFLGSEDSLPHGEWQGLMTVRVGVLYSGESWAWDLRASKDNISFQRWKQLLVIHCHHVHHLSESSTQLQVN